MNVRHRHHLTIALITNEVLDVARLNYSVVTEQVDRLVVALHGHGVNHVLWDKAPTGSRTSAVAFLAHADRHIQVLVLNLHPMGLSQVPHALHILCVQVRVITDHNKHTGISESGLQALTLQLGDSLLHSRIVPRPVVVLARDLSAQHVLVDDNCSRISLDIAGSPRGLTRAGQSVTHDESFAVTHRWDPSSGGC